MPKDTGKHSCSCEAGGRDIIADCGDNSSSTDEEEIECNEQAGSHWMISPEAITLLGLRDNQ